MNQKILYLIIGLLLIVPIQSHALVEATLTWSTNTYTPIDYQGKALPSRNSLVEVVANIDSLGINPQELTYDWSINYHIQKGKSGPGKQVLEFRMEGNIYQEYLIKAEIKNTQNELIASSDYLLLKTFEPEIILKTASLPNQYQFSSNQEVEFIAQPYFFNIQSIDDLNYRWSIGDKTALEDNSKNPNVFILKIGEIVESIVQKLNIWTENKKDSLQRTQSSIEINLIP